MLDVQHRFNPLHVYCRLVDRGLSKKLSLSICRYYEILIYSWLAWFTIVVVWICKLTQERIMVKVFLLLLCVATLVLGLAGLAKAIPVEFTDAWYPITPEITKMLVVGFLLIGLAGFGKRLSIWPLRSEVNQSRSIPQDNGGRRWRFERRQLPSTSRLPERRSEEDRRSGRDRRRIRRSTYAR